MKYKIYYGGWYQRTTLHLSEIYDFLYRAHSELPLDSDKLKALQESLDIRSVSRESDYLEYVAAQIKEDIKLKYFEDGLYLLEIESSNVTQASQKLEDYFTNNLSPAIAYIFSLGAPTPKVLANIQQRHPLVVVVESSDHAKYSVETKTFGEVYATITSDNFSVYKTPNYIVIAAKKGKGEQAVHLVEMQIFFREFKDQLEKYLNIHRKVWEEITVIKDTKSIRGMNIVKTKMKLDSYDRSINLISNRINQMGTYVKTRQSISKELKIENHLAKVFDYKFETLVNTLAYIKEIWAMTKDYVKNVTSVLTDIENQSLNNSIKSLQIITSIGVVSGIMNYLTRSELPRITNVGWQYLGLLIIATLLINLLIIAYYRSIKYNLKISDTSSDL